MMRTILHFFIITSLAAGTILALTPLPQGNTGLAAQYPGDAGISANSAVVFADNFESYASVSNLSTRWNGGVYHYVTLTTATANVYAGAKALQFRNPQQSAELSNTVDRLVNPELDVLFLRYYSKFDPTFDVTGSSHNGSSIQASYNVGGNATPGVKADGYNKFLANLECWRGEAADPAAGFLNVYIYHPEQRDIWGDHFFPTGVVMPWTYLPGNFGPDFISRPDTAPKLGQWYCYEFMVKANTPGVRDGRIACWLDGKLVADFPNLRLRDIDTLKIDRFGISCHIKSNTVCETFKYYDNVVAATSYIGPMTPVTAIESRIPAMLKNGPASFEIHDVRGRLISAFSAEFDSRAGLTHLASMERNLPNGLYVWVLSQGETKRIVKRMVLK